MFSQKKAGTSLWNPEKSSEPAVRHSEEETESRKKDRCCSATAFFRLLAPGASGKSDFAPAFTKQPVESALFLFLGFGLFQGAADSFGPDDV